MRGSIRLGLLGALALTSSACIEEDIAGSKVAAGQEYKIRFIKEGLLLPRSAKDVWIFEKSFLDDMQLVRFDADLDEARTFATRALGRPPVPGENPHFEHLRRGREWWMGDFPEGAEGGINDAARPAVKLALQPNGRSARVWLLLFTT